MPINCKCSTRTTTQRSPEFGAAQIAHRLVVRDLLAVPGEFGASQLGILYLHVVVDGLEQMPREIDHRLGKTAKGQTVSPTAARVRVEPAEQLVIDAPLRGSRYIAGDGCCDSTRHFCATLAGERPFDINDGIEDNECK